MDQPYYAYVHINPVSGKPFYIASGLGSTIHDNSNRSTLWNKYIAHLKERGQTFESKIIHTAETKEEATAFAHQAIQRLISSGIVLLNEDRHTSVQPEVVHSMIDSKDYYPNPSDAISNFIKRKRTEAGLNQTDFAKKAGVALTVVRKIEQGKSNLKIDSVNQVLSMFGSCLVPYQK